MSNPNIPPLPLPDDDRADGVISRDDDETRVDPDIDPDQIDSAEADRIASGADEETP